MPLPPAAADFVAFTAKTGNGQADRPTIEGQFGANRPGGMERIAPGGWSESPHLARTTGADCPRSDALCGSLRVRFQLMQPPDRPLNAELSDRDTFREEGFQPAGYLAQSISRPCYRSRLATGLADQCYRQAVFLLITEPLQRLQTMPSAAMAAASAIEMLCEWLRANIGTTLSDMERFRGLAARTLQVSFLNASLSRQSLGSADSGSWRPAGQIRRRLRKRTEASPRQGCPGDWAGSIHRGRCVRISLVDRDAPGCSQSLQHLLRERL